MKRLSFLLLSIAVACSSVNIKDVEQAPDFTIAKYKTFNYFEVAASGTGLSPNRDANLKVLKEALRKQFELKGLKRDFSNPELMVNIGVTVENKVQTRETSLSNPADRQMYMSNRTYSWESRDVAIGTYREGSVTIHLVDKATNKLVWSGTADSVLPENEKNVPALIEEGAAKLFEKLK